MWQDKINKVWQGDCLKLMKEMPDKCVDLVLTDPPYGMKYQSSRRTATEQFEEIEQDDDLSWFEVFIKDLYRVMKDNTHAYLFCNDYSLGVFRGQAKEAGFMVKRVLVWVKNNHTSGDLLGDYANKTEFILFLHKGRRELLGKRETNVLFFDRVTVLKHPTEKPKEMMGYFINKSSLKGDLIFDPFMGSWTTAVACKQLGRNFIGAELSKEYCEIGEQRLRQQMLL